MKRFIIPVLLIISFGFFFAMIFFSSPYRELRPYEIFRESIPEKKIIAKRNYGNRVTVFIPGNDKINNFYIDQIPVTIAEYRSCIDSGQCKTQHYRNTYTKYWNEMVYGIFPVTFVTWMEARHYCQAFDGDLPTSKQWELAAGSGQNNDYPWGNTLPSISNANIDGFYQWLTPAGWLPKGSSPYGVLDMTGNVREWVLDEIFSDNDNKLLKGGCNNDSFNDGRIESAFNHGPTSSGFNRGFRCVYPE